MMEDIKNQNKHLIGMHEGLKKENEAQTATIQELNDKICEFEQIKMRSERLIITLRGKLEDALQA